MLAVAEGNPTNLRTCTVPGCDRSFYARGLCEPDYQEWARTGKPLAFIPKRHRRPRHRLPPSFKVFRG